MTCQAWPIVWPCDLAPSVSAEQQDAATAAAQSILWARTGRRLGLCDVVELYRPVLGGGGCGVPYMTDDLLWHNGGGRGGSCCAIHLVSLPVYAVTQVRVWGQVVPPDQYRVESNGRLERRGACWPPGFECDDGPSVEVSYTWGVPLTAADPEADPPTDAAPLWGMVAAAMGEVANEVVQGMCGGQCRLPATATSITRQGVTITLPDPAAKIQAKLLGLPLADALIMAVNPNRQEVRSRIYSPDMAQRA